MTGRYRVLFLFGAFLFLASCSDADLHSGQPSLSPSDSLQWFTVYYPTWLQMQLGEQGFGLPPWEIDWRGITHVVHFANGNVQQVPPYFTYGVRNEQGAKDSIDLFYNGIANPGNGQWVNWKDSLVAAAHRQGVKVLLTIQAVDAANLNFVAEDSGRTEVFVRSVADFLRRHHYDGAELNWEGWVTPQTDAVNANRLVRRLRNALNTLEPRGLLLISPGSHQGDYYAPEQDPLVDQYNIQMYDFAFAWHSLLRSNASWYLSPLKKGSVPFGFQGQSWDTRGVRDWISAGHDRKKLGVLMPSFAMIYRNIDTIFSKINDWDVAFDLNTKDVMVLAGEGAKYQWDDAREVPFIKGTSAADVPWPIGLSRGQKFLASFENTRSIKEKISWAQSMGLGGVGMYDLKGDVDPTKPFGDRNFLHRAALDALQQSQKPQ